MPGTPDNLKQHRKYWLISDRGLMMADETAFAIYEHTHIHAYMQFQKSFYM